MAGHPLLQTGGILLELDDGSGTFPYNITRYLDLRAGYTIKRGRSNQFADVEMSEFGCRLKNRDARFTRGNSTYSVFLDQRIRLTETVGATVSKRHTGYVQGWPTKFEGGPGLLAHADIVSVDAFPRLNRKTMSPQIVEEIRRYSPVAYYPLSEPVAATQVINYAAPGKAPASLVPSGAGAGVLIGTGVGVGTDPSPVAPQFFGGQYLRGTQAPVSTPLTGITVLVEFTTTTPAPASTIVNLFRTTGTTYSLTMNAAGQIYAECPDTIQGGTGPSLADGLPHLAMLRYDGTTLELLIDGVVNTTYVTGSSLTGVQIVDVVLGGFVIGYTTGYTGILSHAAVIPAKLTTPQAASLWSIMKSGGAGETSDARMTRLAAYGGFAAADVVTETGILTNVPAQLIADQNPLIAMLEVTKAENGLTFVNGAGKLVMQNRYHRAVQTVPDVTLVVGNIDPDFTPDYDPTFLRNYVTGQRAGGPQIISQDAASILTHGQYPDDLGDLLVTTDAEVQDAADWRRGNYAEASPYVPAVKIDALTASSSVQQQLLAMELSDRINLGPLPSQAPTLGDLIYEGGTETVSIKEWSFVANASPFSAVAAWILGDPVYGVLGSTTRLAQ